MTKLGSDDIPPEIWLEIASHMHMIDIRRAETLNRTFAALVSEDRRSRMALHVDLTYSVLDSRVSPGECKIIAYNAAKKLQERIKDNRASQVKQIIFYSQESSRGPRANFYGFSARVKGGAKQLLLTRLQRSIYERFDSIESLALLHGSDGYHRLPHGPEYMYRSTMWLAWGANLREVSISGGHALPSMLSPEGYRIRLPRLEIMRFAYMQLLSSQGDIGCSALCIVAQLYRPATATLHTLELLLTNYVELTLPITETLLPRGVLFSKLRHFTFKLRFAATSSYEFRSVTSFIHSHSSTLRKLQLGDLPGVVESLIINTPPAFLNHVEGVPPVALSIHAEYYSSVLDPSLWNGASHRLLRQCVVSLKMYNGDPVRTCLHPLSNLRKLSLKWDQHFSLEKFTQTAYSAPQIISLSVRHSASDHNLQDGLRSNTATLDVLRRWKLKDIALYSGSGSWHNPFDRFKATWWYMRHMATLVPSIESYFGRGHMEENLGEPWEQSWVWRKNKYVDEAWDI